MARAEATLEKEPFNPAKVSPSRVNSLVSCGIAFKLKYVDGVPEEISGSAALFGSVVHHALEKWAINREQSLLELMRQAWLAVTEGTVVNDFIGAYAPLSVEAIRTKHEILQRRPEIKNVSMTKDWKTSEIAQRVNSVINAWVDRLNEGSPWRFSEFDPLPALYDESLPLARRYEEKWKHLPPAIHTEFGFDVPWRGFLLNGYIDSVEPVIDRESGELLGLGVLDYKTYKREAAEHKDWRQVAMYDVALRFLIERGAFPLPDNLRDAPLLVGVDYVRLGERKFWRMDPELDHDRLERELRAYKSTVENEAFLPAEKGRNLDFCPYPSQCCLNSTAAAGGCAERVEVNL